MAVNNSLKFYKGWYGKGESRVLPNVPQAIIFNEEEGLVYVNGRVYGGASDVTFDKVTQILRIAYSDGRQPVEIDFSDTASASATMAVFENIESILGASVMGSESEYSPDYGGTNYLSEEETFVDADRRLDEVLRSVSDAVGDVNERIDALDTGVQTVDVTAATSSTGVKLTFKGVSQTDGLIGEGSYDDELQFAKVATSGQAGDVVYSNSTSGIQSENVQGAIDELTERVKDIESTGSFDTVVSTNAANTPQGVTWMDGQDTVTGSLVPSADTMQKVYLVLANGDSSDQNDWYDEYISVKDGDGSELTYTWTKIGTTQAELKGYLKSVTVNGKEYTAGENSTNVTIGTDIVTGVFGESQDNLNNTDFVNVKVTTSKDQTLGTDVRTLMSSVKVVSIAEATDEDSDIVDGLATALDVKKTIEALDADLKESDSNNSVEVSLTQADGKVETLGVDVTYAGITVNDGSESEATVTVAKSNGLVIGSDVTKLVDFTNTRIREEIANLNSYVVSGGSEDEPIGITISQVEGVVTDVETSVLGANVMFDATGSDESLEVENENGVVLGSDVLKLKEYVDTKFLNDGTTVSNSAGEDDAISLTVGTDPQGNKNYDITLVWSEWEEQGSEPEGE